MGDSNATPTPCKFSQRGTRNSDSNLGGLKVLRHVCHEPMPVTETGPSHWLKMGTDAMVFLFTLFISQFLFLALLLFFISYGKIDNPKQNKNLPLHVTGFYLAARTIFWLDQKRCQAEAIHQATRSGCANFPTVKFVHKRCPKPPQRMRFEQKMCVLRSTTVIFSNNQYKTKADMLHIITCQV